MYKCLILSGIPNSGKSTWARNNEGQYWILSCDNIRLDLHGGKYIFDPKKEEEIWETFYRIVEKYARLGYSMMIDNTNCKRAYIDKIISLLPPEYKVEIKYFPIPLWKAQLRNIRRWVVTGKYVPWNIMKIMHKNFKNLTKK